MNDTCSSVFAEASGSVVSFGADCSVSILSMCNGVQNCENCADEVEANCMQIECLHGETLKSYFIQ